VTRRSLYPRPWVYRFGWVLLLLGAVLVAQELADVLRAVGVQ
jgi:hypothetical protein